MNDDTDKPLNTVGDDALEARITAWVLGEASSFEAGELEKLCAADPALGLFERRLRVLHGLVAEDFKAGPAAEWKLSAARRAKVTDLLGVAPEVEEKIAARRKKSRGPTMRGLTLALAACLVFGIFSIWLIGGVGSSGKSAGVREKSMLARYSTAEAPRAMAPSEDYGAVAERGAGAPVKKPDSSYAHLETNSPFSSKPPPPLAMREAQVARQPGASGLALDGVDRSNPGAGSGGPSGATLAEPSVEPASRPLPDAQALAVNERRFAAKAKESGAKLSDHVIGYAGDGLPAEEAPPLASRSNADFIPPVGGATIPGVPAAPESSVTDIVTAGNRSGDAAIRRDNIDAVLNNPDRAAGAKQQGEGLAALTGTFSDEAIAQVEKKMAETAKPAPPASSMAKVATGTLGIDAIPAAPARPAEVEGKDKGLKGWTGGFGNGAVATDGRAMEDLAGNGRIAGAVESEGTTRGPETGKSVDWLVAGKGDEAGLGGAGGMPQELEVGTFFNMDTTSQSRFKSNLRLGSERELGQGDATSFGDLDAMGRLAGETKPRQALDYQGSPIQPEIADESGKPRLRGGVDVIAGSAIGGLKRDLTVEPGAAPVDAKGGERAKMLEEVEKAWDRSVADADRDSEPQGKAAEGKERSLNVPLLMTQDATDITADVLKDLNKRAPAGIAPSDDEVRARILEEVDRAWELSVPADGKAADSAGGDLLEEYRKVGKYEEARELAAEMLAKDANNADAKRVLGHLDDPIRANPALAYEHAHNVDEVRRKLYLAEGNHNLGKFEDAQKTYEEVLRIDPYNQAARRGMEKVAAARSDYYRAAYDQTRAELQVETDEAKVDSGSANVAAVPAEVSELQTLLDFDKAVPDTNGRYSSLAQKEMIRRQSSVAQSDSLRDEGRTAYAAGNYAEAYRKYVESLRVLPDAPMVKDRRDYIQQVLQDAAEALAITAERVGEKELAAKWKEKKLEWAPKQAAAVEPTAETLAADEPFSTFSLHVSDASFKLAHAAMERGEVPAAEGIRPEEFYNAFDYGDPAPANGEPVVCVTEQSAHPAFAQRNLLRIGVRTGSQGRGASTPLNLTLLLDHSGSMEREDRNAGLAMAVRQLSGLLKDGDTITVAGFSRQPRLLADRLPGARAQELNDLIAQTPSEGGTNLEEGLKLGEELAKRQFDPAAQNRVVLFTDGAANLGDARPEALQARIEALRQQGIAFDAAGFGADGLNDKLLERLTRNGNGRYYIVDGPEDADAGFAKQLAGAFRPAAENVKVQVRFNPARVAKYKLIGFEEHRLQKEDFRNDAVDAAEMAAEEAGNALYQIETLPQGEGEVGEVSVRFRDVASGQMVERTWTIPYDAQAPAFDQATPSIQLAGLAAFTAEKLRAAPMADAVDFQQLGQVYAGVRARYPNSQPVADLGSMIGKMK